MITNKAAMDPTYRRWSDLAIYCHDSQNDCDHCCMAIAYDFNKDKNCQMPKAVEWLLTNHIEIPINRKRHT